MQDNDTAKYVSEALGEGTILLESGNVTEGVTRQRNENGTPGSFSQSYQSTYSYQPKERRLLQAAEVRQLSPRVAVTFTPGVPPIWTTLTRYYEEKPKTAFEVMKEKWSIVARCVAVLVSAVLLSVCVVKFVNQQVNHVRIHGHFEERR